MNISNIQSVLASESSFRIKQIEEAIFKNLIEDWDEAKNLPIQLIEKLKQTSPLSINAILKTSKDLATAKALIFLEDNQKIETVLMRHSSNKSPSQVRNSICVSTQVGCPMGCKFCATGLLGLTRSLSQDEIIKQVLYFARLLKKGTFGKIDDKISNITFMGMGEPFLNYDNVIGAIKKLNEKNTLNLGARRFSISTCGVIEGIDKLADENLEVNLAISLHAPNDELRTKIMPSNRKYPLQKILESVKNYYKKTHRKIMIEYIMLGGVNDKIDHAIELSKILKGLNCMVNLIPYNPTYAKENPSISLFNPTSANQIHKFKEILKQNKINSTQRFEHGQDIDGACGQLSAKENLT